MSDKKINLEEILEHHVDELDVYHCRDAVKNAMKEACRQVLELAAENAKAYVSTNGEWTSSNVDAKVNKQSIIDTVKQIE